MLKLKPRWFKSSTGEKDWSWQITGTCPYSGKPVRKGTRTRDENVANAILVGMLNEARLKKMGATAGGVLFKDAVAEYALKRGEADARFIHPLLDVFEDVPMRDITDTMLTDFCDKRYPGRSPATVVRQVYGPMQAIWNVCAALQPPLVPPRDFSRPTVVKAETRYDRNDVALRKIVPQLRRYEDICAVAFMTFTGARASEVVGVRVKHYDPESGKVELIDRKNDDDHMVAFPPEVNDMLRTLAEGRDQEELLFRIKSRWTLYKILQRASGRAGIAKADFLSPHKLGRHTFAARFLKQGNSLKALQQAGGWKSIGAVMRYSHMEQSGVHSLMARVVSPLLNPPAQYLHSKSDGDQTPSNNQGET